MNWKILTVSSSLVVGLLLQINSAEAMRSGRKRNLLEESQRDTGATASSSTPTAAEPTAVTELTEYKSLGAFAEIERDTEAASNLH